MPNINNTENAANFDLQSDDVFGRIAMRYNLLSDLFSFGIHRLWKQRVANIIAKQPWHVLLDAAAGTGDIVLRVAKHQQLSPQQRIIATDISTQMLAIAQQQAIHLTTSIEFQLLNAESMPNIENGSIDLFSISLGLKICDRHRVLQEAYRVLRPNGHLVILEASNISCAWLQRIYLSYMNLCMPIIGWIATRGDSSAYQYLLKGIRDFPTAEKLAEEIAAVGFTDVYFERLSLGIVAIHVAKKPSDSA